MTAPGLPRALTPFIGRQRELAALAAAVSTDRLVTATGPGGVGKTRLSIEVAGRVASDFADGVAFVDLVSVTDDDMVVVAVAEALDVPETAGVPRRDAVVAALASRRCLLIVDNCEHVLAGARSCIAQLVARCPLVHVLATSRIRLIVSGETVFPVPGLSVDGDEGGAGDAVALFAMRVGASGVVPTMAPDDVATIQDICRRLEGMALAIELAAARVASFGLDGVAHAVAASQELLTLAPVVDDRHGSLGAAIEWSYRLLDEADQALLRTITVFAAPFDLAAAVLVTEVPATQLLATLGRLVDWNLAVLRPGRPTRYRVLETIRQYASERAAERGELDGVHDRHLSWCHAVFADLLARAPGDGAWCAEVDALIDDARAALVWASARPAHAPAAAALADVVGAVSFQRGHPGEAQRRYEQASDLAPDEQRPRWLRLAAACALTRYVGDEATDLLERAVEQAQRSGDRVGAALDLARLVTVRHRHDGTMNRRISTAETDALLDRARGLDTGSAHVDAAIAVADACRGDVARSIDVAIDAVAAARSVGEVLLTDAALDQLCSAQLEHGDLAAAANTVTTRLRALATVPIDAASGMDHADAQLMAAHVDLGLGRLPTARRHADALATLPFLREQRHVGLARRLEVDALAGAFDDVAATGDAFRDGWVRAGRPRVNNFGSAAYAVAMVHGIRGDDDRRAEWVQIATRVLRDRGTVEDATFVWPAVFDGLLLVHRSEPDAALARLAHDPDRMPPRVRWYQQLWLPWYAAVWAEASTMAGHDVEERLARATVIAGGNDVAQLVIERTTMLAAGRAADVTVLAERFNRLGCAYQAQRTQLLVTGAVDRNTRAGPLATLSNREMEVLRLVAAGQSNPQIATELFISRKTAEHHVSNILTKLGVGTRAEAAVLATRHAPER